MSTNRETMSEVSEGPCPHCGVSPRPGAEPSQVEEIEGDYFWDALIPVCATEG